MAIFYQNKNLEPFFANRTKIFGKNIYFDDGAYGIWDWSAKRSEVYPSKDYVRSGKHFLIILATRGSDKSPTKSFS